MTRVSVAEQKGLVLGDSKPQIWNSGTFHYWRVDPALWVGMLKNIKAMGFEMIETYVAWGVHEIERGKFEWGEKEPKKNLEKFIQLVHQSGLKLIVRPGPHINAELNYFGYPPRIVYDPEIVAREASGCFSVHDAAPKAFGNPSYASKKFYEETALWFDALAPILKRNRYPEGPIVALQVDNETGYFFRIGAYLMDYHTDSIQWYRHFLQKRHKTVEKLNQCYGSKYKSFNEVEPPRFFEGKKIQDLPYYLDWSRYKEWQINECLRLIGNMWKERGIDGIPFFQNFFGPTNSPFNTNDAEQGDYGLDVVGLDDYPRKENHYITSRKASYLAGSSRLPFIPEFGSGCWSLPLWEYAMTIEDQRFTTPLLFMFGLKAINYYMIVERDRWIGCPISVDNEIRKPYFNFYKDWNAFLKQTQFHDWNLQSDLLVLANYDVERFLKSFKTTEGHFLHLLPDEVTYSPADLGFAYRPEEEYPRWAEKQWTFVSQKHLPFRTSDTVIDYSKMKGYKTVWVPTLEFMDRTAQKNLRRFAEEGGTVLLGPVVPSLDENMVPFSCFEELKKSSQSSLGKGKMVCVKTFNEKELMKVLMESGVKPVLENLSDEIKATRFTYGSKEMFFLANPTQTIVQGEVPGPNWTLVWGKPYARLEGKNLSLDPWSVSVWEVRS